jgi:hypothetical protein
MTLAKSYAMTLRFATFMTLRAYIACSDYTDLATIHAAPLSPGTSLPFILLARVAELILVVASATREAVRSGESERLHQFGEAVC